MTYKIEYRDRNIKSLICDRHSFWDFELKEELDPILKQLRHQGEIKGAKCGFTPGVNAAVVYEFTGKTFQIVYAVFPEIKTVKIREFCLISPGDPNPNLTGLGDCNLADDEEEPTDIYIPQIEHFEDILQMLKLIYEGVNDSYNLGLKLGSKAKSKENVSRRGNYFGKATETLGLTEVSFGKNRRKIYNLTTRGHLIAKSQDRQTQERLFAETLLGFRPVQILIEETTHGENPLDLELIQETIALCSIDCSGTTIPRKAHSLRELTNWVARHTGTPILQEGQDGIQLYIPYIYAPTNL